MPGLDDTCAHGYKNSMGFMKQSIFRGRKSVDANLGIELMEIPDTSYLSGLPFRRRDSRILFLRGHVAMRRWQVHSSY